MPATTTMAVAVTATLDLSFRFAESSTIKASSVTQSSTPTTITGAGNYTETTTPLKLPFDNTIVTIYATIIFFLLVFGFFANLLTILVIVTSTQLKTVFNQLILSLCVSDLLSALISWINLYRRTWGFDRFYLPNFFCVFYWGADIWTSYITAVHIFLFAILRLISIWKPVFFSKIKALYLNIIICVIWGVTFTCGFIPFAIMRSVRIRDRSDRSTPVWRWPSCTLNIEWLSTYKIYTKFAFPVFIYVPLFGVALVSLAIAIVMLKQRRSAVARTEKRKRKEKQAMLQLGLIVGSFMLGYVPFTAFEFRTIDFKDKTFAGWRYMWMFGMVQYIMLRFSECLNPVFYNLASTKMRKETKAFFNKIRTVCRAEIHQPNRRSSATGIGDLVV